MNHYLRRKNILFVLIKKFYLAYRNLLSTAKIASDRLVNRQLQENFQSSA